MAYHDHHDFESYGDKKTKLSNFDKLAVWICVLGAAIIFALHMIVVKSSARVYGRVDDLIPGMGKVIMTPGYAAASAMLMLFLAWYGTRMRRLFNNKMASRTLFAGIVTAIATNGLLIWAVYSPASRSMRYLG